MTTTNLAEFGTRELHKVEELLRAMRLNGFPKDFENNEVLPMLNKNSGYVFLTNAYFQVCMINEKEEELESFYSCPICGHEGFYDEMIDHSDDEECIEYVDEIAKYN